MDAVKIALDWTANTNHIGFYVAQELNFYQKQNIQIEIITPAADNYQTTPAKKVELGQVDFALCPMESIISYRTKARPFPLKAIAALFEEDLSAITTLKGSGIDHPRQLDGKTYASYRARYEDGIVRQMIKNDGGKGEITIVNPDKLGIWNTLLAQKSDATWIFINWEGIQAEGQGLELNYFKLKVNIYVYISFKLCAGAQLFQIERLRYSLFLFASYCC